VPAKKNQSRRRATSRARRRHNPAVAQYLGLGSTDEPSHLEKYAPLPAAPDSSPPNPVRKRRKLADGEKILSGTRATADRTNAPEQRRVSESFRVKKPAPARKSAGSRSKTSTSETRALPTHAGDLHATTNNSNVWHDSYETCDEQVSQSTFADESTTKTASCTSPDTISASPVEDLAHLRMFDLEADHNEPDHIDRRPPLTSSAGPVFEDDDYDIDIDDDDLLNLTSEVEVPYSDGIANASSSPVKSDSKFYDSQPQTTGSSTNTSMVLENATTTNSSQRSTKQFVSPVTVTTKLLAATGDVGSARAQKPIVRPPFPETVRDRSPIIGLSSNSLLRTCFRIGEVINQSCQASKSGKHMVFELYARIFASERTDTEQHFTFCDLFHAKPPHIKGVYNAAIWTSVQLFEYDSRRLLKQGRMCRCIGTMKRVEKEWVMTVLNIWEATWEDIEWVEGIVNF
jgi:hypothetical protein